MKEYAAIHQFHSGTAQGDAITQQMVELQRHLRRMGHASEIFAEHVAEGLQDRIHPIAGYPGSSANLLLVHHSLGHAAFDDVVGRPDDVVAVYHNITPAKYFSDPYFRQAIRLGREQLSLLALRALVGIADSNFNRQEMLEVGFRRVEVLPVRTDFSEFVPTSKETGHRSTDWLYVGRIVENKCQHDLVRAFALYVHNFNDDDARLILVGELFNPIYVEVVRQEARRWGVEDRVVLLGKVSDQQLRSAFLGAGVFVSLSEHEGFGVPILEAMAARLPVVGYAATAVPETMGGAGILLRTKDPEVVAATVQVLKSDADLQDRLVARQDVRVREVQTFNAEGLLTKVIGRAGGAAQPLEVQVQGPFETSYSLAIMNRSLACALDGAPDRALSIHATEGHGDYQPNDRDLEGHPRATTLFRRSRDVPYPHVVIRQMWPPRLVDSPGGLTCEYFGWEESRIPQPMVDDFNCFLDGIGVTSHFVKDVLRDSGVDVPIAVVWNGVEPHDPYAVADALELEKLRSYRFLHISSAFPRKGVDVLLDAYFSAFDGLDDVSLILKTFPNPHNTVADLLASLRARHPNPPDVRWIDRDMDERTIQGLYNLSHCYVHPARGEGFGLPVAEAMAAEVPVISLAYSGLADFVSNETASTIPFRLEPAETHLEVPYSVWAEPDGAQLVAQLRAHVEDVDARKIAEQVQRARDLVTTRFTWSAAARRWNDFLAHVEDAAEKPRVAMVTTWNVRCGVAENVRSIVDHAGGKIAIDIFANVDPKIVDPTRELGVLRNWDDRWHPDLDGLEEALRLSDAEVVHFQFNFGFFELSRLAQLIERQLVTRGVVVTLHRTKDATIDGEVVSLSSIKAILQRVDRLIVHQVDDAQVLADMGLSDNVMVVPLGASAPPSVSPAEAKAALGLGTRPVVGTFGFLLPHKGTLELVRAVGALSQEFPDICLLALCARYPDVRSDEYEAEVRAEIDRQGLGENILLMTEYLPDDTVRTILRAADVIALPYGDTAESSSAALRFLLPLERPLVVTDRSVFADCREWTLAVDPHDPQKIEEALRRVLVDPELHSALAARAGDGARRFRWSRVIADHREIYVTARLSARERRGDHRPLRIEEALKSHSTSPADRPES
ncbi:MAG TPA: glycosyltransferase [Acidimicrobiales bacterium]|jgi:glycosyltransferase involved in cell wall biosynthesis